MKDTSLRRGTDEWFEARNAADDHSDVVTRIVDAKLTLEFMHALGWQGGTVHQVADEIIKRGLQNEDIYSALRIIASDYWRIARV